MMHHGSDPVVAAREIPRIVPASSDAITVWNHVDGKDGNEAD